MRYAFAAPSPFLLLVLLALMGSPLAAETFVVNRFDDADGPCTPDDCALRVAILAANALPGPDIVEVPGGTYHLSLVGPVPENFGFTGDLDIRNDLELLGDPGSPATIVGDGTDRVIDTFVADVVTVSDLILTGGTSASGGGGLRSDADFFRLRNCTVQGNTSVFGGGGLIVGGDDAVIENCTITGNQAPLGRGGGVYLRSASLLQSISLVNVTITGNSADVASGLYVFGQARFRLIHTTIADNTANLIDGVVGDLLVDFTFQNSLIVNNDCGYVIAIPKSNGHNVEGPTDTCFVPGSGDLVGVPDLVLEPLADNGGTTQTRALPPGSPAIDVALDADCPATDQRGVSRPQDGDGDFVARCDAGAYEVASTPVVEVPGLDDVGRVVLAGLLLVAAIEIIRRGGTP